MLANILPGHDQIQNPVRLNGIVEDRGHSLREGGYMLTLFLASQRDFSYSTGQVVPWYPLHPS